MIAQFLSFVFIVLIFAVLILVVWKLIIPFIINESKRQEKIDQVNEYRRQQAKVEHVHVVHAEEELKQELGDLPFSGDSEGKNNE